MLDLNLSRTIAAGAACLALILTPSAQAQQLLTLGDVCSYYGEEIEDAVYGFESDKEAEDGVQRIVDHTGLPQNFTIMAANVPNAAAEIDENGDRLILYNQTFMKRITETARTDWAAVSILAHEIGHHLSGHTLKRGGSRPEIELQADSFSGFVLFKMGASLEDAQAAMEALAGDQPSATHPPKSARLAAIANGWTRAREQGGGQEPSAERERPAETAEPRDVVQDAADPLDCYERRLSGEDIECETGDLPDEGGFQGSRPVGNAFVAHCSFYDGSAVSIDQQNRLLTFINGATIEVGFRQPSGEAGVQYELFLTSNDVYVATLLTTLGVYNVTYYVDQAGTIWRPNGYGGVFQVGTCQ